MYVICDLETGRFVTSDSVFITKDEIVYTSYTGEADGIEYCHTIESAQKILHSISTILERYGIAKSFVKIQTERKNIPEGKMIIEYFQKKKLKIA